MNGRVLPRLACLLTLIAVILGPVGSASAAVLLGSSQFGDLFSVDTTTGAGTFIGLMPPGPTRPLATEIEADFLTGALYAEEGDGGVELHTIDRNTGASLGFVTHPYGALNGLEFVGPTLYGTFIPQAQQLSDLVTVNTATGVLTSVGLTGLGPISGLAFNPTNATMYGVTAGGGPADLVTINLATGVATPVGPITVAGIGQLDHIGSIEFASDGNLYGGVTMNGLNPNDLILISPATGVATVVGNTGFSITGLTNPAVIPEPTSIVVWSLLVALGVTVAGWRRRR